MRRICALILLLALLIGIFTACGGGDGVPYTPAPVMIANPVATHAFGIAFQRGNAALRDQVWAALQVLSADGTVHIIARRWFGTDPTTIPPDADATARLEEVRERTLIIGFDPAHAPMSFIDQGGELVGFDIDLARAVCDYFGWSLELLPIQWADREVELSSGNIDALWGGVPLTEQTRARLYHTEVYMENSQVVVTMSSTRIRNLRGVRNRALAYRTGSMAELALIENTSFARGPRELVPYDVLSDALRALAEGEVDAVLMDQWSADFYIRTADADAFGGREMPGAEE